MLPSFFLGCKWWFQNADHHTDRPEYDQVLCYSVSWSIAWWCSRMYFPNWYAHSNRGDTGVDQTEAINHDYQFKKTIQPEFTISLIDYRRPYSSIFLGIIQRVLESSWDQTIRNNINHTLDEVWWRILETLEDNCCFPAVKLSDSELLPWIFISIFSTCIAIGFRISLL